MECVHKAEESDPMPCTDTQITDVERGRDRDRVQTWFQQQIQREHTKRSLHETKCKKKKQTYKEKNRRINYIFTETQMNWLKLLSK